MNNNPVIIVSGKEGQLGFEIQQLAKSFAGYHFEFSDKDTFDITDENEVKAEFEKLRPAYFINCAAYTAVDKAETDREVAMKVNAEAVGLIAKYCKLYNTILIHISTDYVFNGKGTAPYQPDDPTEPVNFYGYTKCVSEQLALENNPQTIIIRTSWVYSSHGHNFVKTMLRLMSERDEISVVNDQVGSPTYASDLAEAILKIVNKTSRHKEGVFGIYHFSNSGVISWHDFATKIMHEANLDCKINPVSTAGYPTPAARPNYSVMDTSKITKVFDIKIVPWRDSLQGCLKLLIG